MMFKSACCQMNVTNSKKENLRIAEDMIKEASNNGAELIVLPEMFQCPYENSAFPKYAEEDGGETTTSLSDMAKANSCFLFGGSIPELCGTKIYNTAYAFDRNGKLIGKHRKIHLFDIDVKDEISFRESDTLTCGENITVINTEFGKIGLAICFDIRFPELFISMAELGAEIIVVPAAFNTHTGPKYWDTLLKARALDCQSYIIACSPSHNYSASYHAYGHSCVISPMGERIASTGHKADIVYSEIGLSQVKKARAQLPVLSSRRKDLY